jgi:hypothetical protein
VVLSALTPSDPFQRVGEFVLQYCELCRVYEVRLYLLWCNIVHVVETYVSGETAKSAERGLFVQCWQGIGRNCHGGNEVKAWDSFTSWITQGLFYVDVVKLGWACNTSWCLYIVDMNAAYE